MNGGSRGCGCCRGGVRGGGRVVGVHESAAGATASVRLIGLDRFVKDHRIGIAMRAAAEDFAVARLMGIRANTVAPGYTKTEMTGPDEELSPVDQYFASKTPIARPGYPDDFEGIAAYLASDASRWHSGDTIVIDGAALINL